MPRSKLTLRDVDVALRQLTGTSIARWFSVELPQVRNAILTRLPDVRAAVHRAVERIADLPGEARDAAFAQLVILAGLRSLGDVMIREEAKEDADSHRYFGS